MTMFFSGFASGENKVDELIKQKCGGAG